MRNSRSSWPSSPSRVTPTLPEPSSRAVVLDTDVASRSFKGLLPPRLAARLAGRQPLLTFVTIGELTQWAKLRRWGPRNRGMLDAWLSDKPVIPGAKGIAVLWGELSAGATQRGRPRPVNDTWVAACCLAYSLPLATLNVKDFADFAEHDGLVLIRA
jgi:predicted nucleic acid-binding protein